MQYKKYYVILRYATPNKNKSLQERLKDTRIKAIFLPAYLPNLNLIGRLWKFMRKKVKDSCFTEKFENFKEKVFEFFERIAQYQQELKTLISWNFHVLKSKTSFH
ncbi:MAG: transposase [Raineya sp.]|nr:transposase [Raineya sp.]MDW8297308.1 transposase [Raineya sp.]